jgi:serine protease
MSSNRTRRRTGIALGVLAAATAMVLGTSTAATATATPSHATTAKHTSHHKIIMPQHHAKHTHAAAASSGLVYGGGPVETTPVVYLVFWGSQWDSDSNGVASYMQGFFGGVGTPSDNWSTIMTQYTDSTGASPTFGSSVLGGVWVDDGAPAPSNAAASDISNEANNGAAHFGVSGPNSDVFVMSPSGTSPDGFPSTGFCAWHDWNGNVAYTNMPYVLDAGSSCGANSVQNQLDGFSIVGGHEYAEAVTDPEPPSGWVDPSGQENGDLCAWQGLTTLSLPTGSFAIQPTWSNAIGGCATSG